MSKSLNVIQTISKIAKVICSIGFVFSIIGGVGCLIGIASLSAFDGLVIDGKEFSEYIIDLGEVNVHTAYERMTFSVLSCIAGGIILKFAERYLAHEIADGTPFTERGASEILRLGILIILLPLAAIILGGIAHGIFTAFWKDVAAFEADNVSIGAGFFCILLSFLFRYGAEVKECNRELTKRQQKSVDEPNEREV